MNHFEDGMHYFQEKNYQDALKSFKLAIDNNVNTEECRNRMGEIYESILKYDLAFEMYNRNIKLKNDAEAYFRITHMLMNQDKVEQAMFFINQATQLHPHTPSLYYMKGLVLQQKLQQHDEAIINFDKCLQRDPQYKEAILKKIESLFELKDYKAIIEAYNKYLKIDSNNIEVYKKIGNVQILQSQYKNAVESYLQCISMDDNFTEAYHNLGSVYQILHQYDAAIQIFDQCISAMLKTAKNLAMNQDSNNKGLTKKKRRILIAQRRKTQEQILTNLVVQRKFEELLLFLDKLLLPWKDLLAKSAEYVQERKKSIAIKSQGNLKKNQGISPRFQQILFLQLSKAKCLKELGKYEESMKALKVCEDSQQHVNECLLLQSKLLMSYKIADKVSNSEEDQQEESKNNNNNNNNNNQSDKESQDNNTQWQQTQRKEAIKCLQNLLERDPTDLKALLQLGEIYEIEKEIPKQISIYQFILENDPYNEEAISKLINLSKKGFTIDNIRELRGKLNSSKHSQYEHFIYCFMQADSFMDQTEVSDFVSRFFNEGIKFYQQNKFQAENSSSFLKLFFYFSRLYNLSVNHFNLFNDSTSPQSMIIFAKALFKSNQITRALEVIEFISREYAPANSSSGSTSQDNIILQNAMNQQPQIGSKLNVANTQSLLNNILPTQNIQASQQNLLSKIETSKAHSSSMSSNNLYSLTNSSDPSLKNQFKKIHHLVLIIQGQCFERLQLYEKALICYSDAVRIAPKFYLLYYYRGILYYKMGLLGDALKNAERAIQLNCFHPDSLFLIAKIYSKQQKKVECQQSLQKGLKLLSNSISLTHISDEDDADFLLADSGRTDELNEENYDQSVDQEDEQEFDFFIQQKIKKLQKSNMTSTSITTERNQSHIQEGIQSFEGNYLDESKFHLETELIQLINKEERSLLANPLLLLCIDHQNIKDTRFAAHFYLNQIYIKKMNKDLNQKQPVSNSNLDKKGGKDIFSNQNLDKTSNTNLDKQSNQNLDKFMGNIDHSPQKLGYLINKALLYLSQSQYNLGINIFFDELFPKYVSNPDSSDESAEAVIFASAIHLIHPLYTLGLNEKLIKLCEHISEFKKKIKKKLGTMPVYLQEKLPSTEYLIIISIANFRMGKYEESINCLQSLLQTHLDPAHIVNSSSNKFKLRWQEYVKLTHFFLSLNYSKLQNIPNCLNHLQIYLRETPENQKQMINTNVANNNNNNGISNKQNQFSQQQLSSSSEILLQHLQSECSYILMVDLLLQNKLSSEAPLLCEAILESLYEQVRQYSLPTILSTPRQGYFTSCQHLLSKSLKNIITQKIKPQFEGSLRVFFSLINDEHADLVSKLFDFYEYSYFDRQSNLNSHLLVKLEAGNISQIMNPISGKKIILSEQRCEARRIKTSQEQREMLYRLILSHRCLLKIHFFLKQGRDIYILQDESTNTLNTFNSSRGSLQTNSPCQIKNELSNQGSNLNKPQDMSFGNGSHLYNSNNNSNYRKLYSIGLSLGEESKATNHQIMSLVAAIIHLVDCMQYLHKQQIYSANFSIDSVILSDSNIPIITTFDDFSPNFSSSPHLNVIQLIHLIKTILPSCQLTQEQLQQQIEGQSQQTSPSSFANLLIYVYQFLNKYNILPSHLQTKQLHNIPPSDFDVYSTFLNELSQILHQIAITSFLFQSQSTYKSIDNFYNFFIQGIISINRLSNCKNILPLMNIQEKDLLNQSKGGETLTLDYNQFFNQVQISVELPYLLNDEMYTLVNRFVQLSQLDIIQKQELLNELYIIKSQNTPTISANKAEKRSRNIMKMVEASDGRDEFILSLVSNFESLMSIQDDIDSRDQNQLFSYLISLIKNPLKDDFFQRFIKRKKVYYEWKQDQQQDILKRMVRNLYVDEELRQEKYDKFVRVLSEYQTRSRNDSITQREHEQILAKAAQAGRQNKREEDGTLQDDIECIIEQTTSANSFSISYYAQQKDNRANINVMSVFSQRPQLSSASEEDEIMSTNRVDPINDLQIINEIVEDENITDSQKKNYQNELKLDDDVIPRKVQESQALRSEKDSKIMNQSSSQFKTKNNNNNNNLNNNTLSNALLKEADVTESVEYSQFYHQKNVQELKIQNNIQSDNSQQ